MCPRIVGIQLQRLPELGDGLVVLPRIEEGKSQPLAAKQRQRIELLGTLQCGDGFLPPPHYP